MPKVVNVRQTILAMLMGTALTAGSAWAAKITAPETVDPGQTVQIQIEPTASGGTLELWGPVTNTNTGGQIASWKLTGATADIQIDQGPGSYQLRQTAEDGTVLATKLIDVAATAITLQAPEVAIAGAEMELTWEGPATTDSQLAIVERGTDTAIELHDVPKQSGTMVVQAPDRTGNYAVQYRAKGTVLTEIPLEVVAGGGWLRGPLTVDASQEFSVEWLGPIGPAKTVRIATEAGEEFYAQITMSGQEQGPGFATIIAPDRPGRYVIQVIDNATGDAVSSLPLVVDPA